MNTNIYWDFQICISVPLIYWLLLGEGRFVWIWTSKGKGVGIFWTQMDQGDRGSWKLDNFHECHMCIIPNLKWIFASQLFLIRSSHVCVTLDEHVADVQIFLIYCSVFLLSSWPYFKKRWEYYVQTNPTVIPDSL